MADLILNICVNTCTIEGKFSSSYNLSMTEEQAIGLYKDLHKTLSKIGVHIDFEKAGKND